MLVTMLVTGLRFQGKHMVFLRFPLGFSCFGPFDILMPPKSPQEPLRPLQNTLRTPSEPLQDPLRTLSGPSQDPLRTL